MSALERSRSHESPLDNFGVDFNCDINTLYTRLTEKPGEIICHLSSNWGDISDTKDYLDFGRGEAYDIFASIKMYLKSDLKIKSIPEIRDRSSRIVQAKAILDNANRPSWEGKVAKIIAESAKLGIDLSFVDCEPWPDLEVISKSEYEKEVAYFKARGIKFRDEPPEQYIGWSKDKFHKQSYLVPENPELGWLIEFFEDSTGHNHISLQYPSLDLLDLEGQQTIQNILQKMSSAIEHMLRVCYAVEGKVLPEKRLVFFPYVEPGKAKEVSPFAPCSYCGSNYSTSEAQCPSCGARAPRPL